MATKCLDKNNICPPKEKLNKNNTLMNSYSNNAKAIKHHNLLTTRSNNSTARWCRMTVAKYNEIKGITKNIVNTTTANETVTIPRIINDKKKNNDSNNSLNSTETCDNDNIEYDNINGICSAKLKNSTIFNKPYASGKYDENLNQNGRWNVSLTNTKLHPVVFADSRKLSKTSGVKSFSFKKRQTNNLFKNTTHKMSKSELYAYLSKNRAHFYR